MSIPLASQIGRRMARCISAILGISWDFGNSSSISSQDPLINIEADEDIDELDAVKVHNDEGHKPQDPIKETAPHRSPYNEFNEKCSFNYETRFLTPNTLECLGILLKCIKIHQ
uniref:Uncharacterized protein n=1 Tax=Romanomermis culicivorax TaxID=13658 RepID=A0A915JRC8_ROMCU